MHIIVCIVEHGKKKAVQINTHTCKHTYENEFRNAMPDNEIENISNKCQKSGASERKIKHVRKRDLNGVQKNIVTCF